MTTAGAAAAPPIIYPRLTAEFANPICGICHTPAPHLSVRFYATIHAYEVLHAQHTHTHGQYRIENHSQYFYIVFPGS